ncbi:hypothetical protein CYLTODRAFT_425895 [Cylindrobasidium torrendii FP15055 ss-10]|uniref:Uncharacterized protein n=1 Tax=Cylindrobasidium torrendii FP15055 ss-10 TaxID=1314674 RepID=A0A0D7AZP6_9AGAR|nr:hypothetical protein CYLTODRAFT_425895 [Cylindrobasidium torrendii FP15055 ss-10]
MVFKFRRKREIPWEVVETRSISPVSMHIDGEGADNLTIVDVGDKETRGTYVFDVKNISTSAMQNAVVFARKQLMEEVHKRNHNILIVESWNLTILRRGHHYRVEVQYAGLGARAAGKLPHLTSPPFMDTLQELI